MTAIPLLFAGACARVVDEDPAQGSRHAVDPLQPLPSADGDPVAAIPIGARVQVLYGPRRGQTTQGATTWWVVRVLTGEQRDRVGWMVEMQPGTESYRGTRGTHIPSKRHMASSLLGRERSGL